MRIMPHIVFDKRINLFDFSKKFVPIFQKDAALIKISSVFIEKNDLSALLPTLVIDKLHQEFLIELSTHKSKTTIRLYPSTDPEKTDEVKYNLIQFHPANHQNFPRQKENYQCLNNLQNFAVKAFAVMNKI